MRRRSTASSKLAKARSRKAKALKAVRQRSSSPAGQETEVARLTRELSEAQEQQTATAEVLKIISTSPTELQPVLEVVARSAARFWEADDVTIFELDGQYLRITAAHWGAVPQDVGARFPCVRGHVSGRAVLDRKSVHVTDLHAEAEEFPEGSAFARRLGFRTTAAVPLLREGVAIGAIVLRRAEVNPFTNKQITLLETFAAQAVIAIENTRLLNELRQRTDELSQRTDDLSEALEQQTATSEVLTVISASPGDLEPVFQAMLENAVRICEAKFGELFRFDGEAFHFAAEVGTPAELVEFQRQRGPFQPEPGTHLNRVIRTKQVSHSADTAAEAVLIAPAKYGGARSIVAVPMLKDDVLIGAISIYRQEVRPFTDKQIEVVKNFAAQAVIAIENTRLLNELRQRTNDLSESLERQTATSEVLKVISSSPGDLQPVFDAILANATDLCGAGFASLRLSEGDQFRTVSLYNAPAALAEHWRKTPLVRPHPQSALGRTALTKQVIQIDDVTKGPAYSKGDPVSVAGVDLGGYRTALSVPMLREDVLVGAIAIYRQEVRPFTEKQIELVTNFAAQAVIAIENARLLNELRQSLQQQTATADVLKIISRSTFDLETVLNTLVESASRHCDAYDSIIFLHQGGRLHVKAHYGPLQLDFADWPIGRGWITGRAFVDRASVQVYDPVASAEEFPDGSEMALRLGYRTILAVPLLREHEAVGVLTIRRSEAKPFTDEQVALVETFADQAVIAIENVRLFEAEQQRMRELSESLEQQTATSDILKVISSSPGDLQLVFEAMLANATRLCEAKFGALWLCEGDALRAVALNAPPAFTEEKQRQPLILPTPETGLGRAVKTKLTVHSADLLAEEHVAPVLAKLAGARTYLAVPMLGR
jgi:GAF domain-containing protein